MRHLLIILLFLLTTWQATACTMQPSLWKQLESIDSHNGPVIYALTDALYQIREKFNKEMQACQLATGPLTFTGAWHGNPAQAIDASMYENLHDAIDVIWKNAKLVPQADMPGAFDDIAAHNAIAAKLPDGYAVTIHITNAKATAINLIDINFQQYFLFRLVMREELRMFVRITDRSGAAVFLDEVAVSPTFIVDPLISPLGGFFIRFEKNTAHPLALDFGPLSDGGQHVLRVNDAFYQPTATPPLPEFAQP